MTAQMTMDNKDSENKLKILLFSLVREGFAMWKGGKPVGSRTPVKIKGKTVSEIVMEDRR